jgi:hypothetical protein
MALMLYRVDVTGTRPSVSPLQLCQSGGLIQCHSGASFHDYGVTFTSPKLNVAYLLTCNVNPDALPGFHELLEDGRDGRRFPYGGRIWCTMQKGILGPSS